MKKTNRKDRYETVTMQYSEPVKIDRISFEANGNFKMFSDGIEMEPLKVHFEKGIERERKNKRTFLAEIDEMCLNIYEDFLNYDYLAALDTNSKGDYSVAVGVIYRIIKNPFYKDEFTLQHVLNIRRDYKFQKTMDESVELIALNSLLYDLQKGKLVSDFAEKKMIIIIDHNLGKLDLFNARQVPLLDYDEHSFLPENVRLIYASADKYNDTPFNGIIRECDKRATKFLKQHLKDEEQC